MNDPKYENDLELQAAFDDGSATKIHEHGFVRVVDTMGDDAAIVQAARVSYGKGTKTATDDRGLIRYLMRRWHTTPFEMCEIKLHVKLPVFIARQWIRHRTANINEISGRYSIMEDQFYVPELSAIKPQSNANKQGRDGELPEQTARAMQETLRQSGEMAFQVYGELHTGWPWADIAGDPWLDYEGRPDIPVPHDGQQGMSRELARINLPLSTYTEFYWKIDLHNLFHFLRLRADPHAQQEIRDYADAICNFVSSWCPAAYEAFVDYRLEAETFSRMEMEALRDIISTTSFARDKVLPFPEGMTKRESTELAKKLGMA